jgi:protein SCO1/2
MTLFGGAALAGGDLPPILREVGIDQRLNQQVPLDLQFYDEHGRTIRLGDYFQGKPVILVLAYYRCPKLCTEVLNGLLEGLRGVPLDIGDEFQVVTVSFDAREEPGLAAAKKVSYVQEYGRPHAADGWHFLTADQPSINRLTEAVGFRYRYDPKQDLFAHASGIMVLTPRGRIARYFFGIKYRSADLETSLKDAAGNKISSPVERVLQFFCYHYDAATGKYTATAMTFVRIGGILTLLVLGTFIIVSWRRDWLKARHGVARGEG